MTKSQLKIGVSSLCLLVTGISRRRKSRRKTLRTTEYGVRRGGVISSVNYDTGNNKVATGIWSERDLDGLARRFYPTSLNGPDYSIYNFPADPYFTQWNAHVRTDVVRGYIEDTYRVTSDITVNAGFKGTKSTITDKIVQANGYASAALSPASGTITASSPFLPQVGANWHIAKGLSWYNGGSYTSSTYDCNVGSGAAEVFTKGKTVVDTPNWLYKTDLSYSYDGFFSHVNGD